jgi:hypothetical protein
MRRPVTALACLAVAAAAATGEAGASSAPAVGAASVEITAVVADSVGIVLADDGSYSGRTGSRATVVREQRGGRLVITVVPQ